VVIIDWKVTGTGTMSVDPPTPGAEQGEVRDQGLMGIAPVTRTRVHLDVTRRFGTPTASEIWIDVDSGKKTLQGTPDCDATHIRSTIAASGFAPSLRVNGVSSARALTVTHAGRTAHLGAGEASATFRGLPVDGDWQLEGALLAGETCGTPSIPAGLFLDVTSQCGGAL
jgi:hypothetical protein